MKFIDFFAGIGGFRRGMELAGHECVAENVVEIWNGLNTIHHKSNVRSADIRYIQNLMSQIVSNYQKHGKNILNYTRKRE